MCNDSISTITFLVVIDELVVNQFVLYSDNYIHTIFPSYAFSFIYPIFFPYYEISLMRGYMFLMFGKYIIARC